VLSLYHKVFRVTKEGAARELAEGTNRAMLEKHENRENRERGDFSV
jgi:hypothetical protein